MTATSPGYEINDLGFQASADRLHLDTEFGYDQTRPGRFLRRWNAMITPVATWNLGGDAQALHADAAGIAVDNERMVAAMDALRSTQESLVPAVAAISHAVEQVTRLQVHTRVAVDAQHSLADLTHVLLNLNEFVYTR